MKYMTADLLARLQSRDEPVVDAAEEAWDRQTEAYRGYLASVQAVMAPGVQTLLRRCLHDAKVLTIATDEEGHLSIFLDLGKTEKPLERYVELRYKLIKGNNGPGYSFVQHAELADHGPPFKEWLYDEIEVVDKSQYAHSILLSGGHELQLTFSAVTSSRLNYLYPTNVEKDVCQVRRGA